YSFWMSTTTIARLLMSRILCSWLMTVELYRWTRQACVTIGDNDIIQGGIAIKGSPMTAEAPVKIELVRYPGAQLSAVLGLSDLFEIANDVVQRRSETETHPTRLLQIGQCNWKTEDKSYASLPNDGDVLILPPA